MEKVRANASTSDPIIPAEESSQKGSRRSLERFQEIKLIAWRNARESRSSRGVDQKLHWMGKFGHFKKFILDMSAKGKGKGKRHSSVQLHESHVRVLSNSPFAPFLSIPDIPNIRGILVNIFYNWESEANFTFSNVGVSFTKKDVALLLGIQDRGLRVEMESNEAAGELYTNFFATQQPDRDSLEKLLKKYAVRVKEEADVLLFCKFYILYLFSSVLFASSTYKLPLGLVDIVDDFDRIGSYNWVEAIYNFMTPQLPIFGEAFTSKTPVDNIPYMKGFAALLAAWFLEHVPIQLPRRTVSPRISKWRPSFSHITKVKAKLATLHSCEIIVDIIPNEEEAHLVGTDIPAESENTISPSAGAIVLYTPIIRAEEAPKCSECIEKDKQIECLTQQKRLLHTQVAELYARLEREGNVYPPSQAAEEPITEDLAPAVGKKKRRYRTKYDMRDYPSVSDLVLMGRGRGKGKKLTVSTSYEDPGENGEEVLTAFRRGKPQKPLKEVIDEDDAEKIGGEDDMKLTAPNEEVEGSAVVVKKKRKRDSKSEENLAKTENGAGSKSMEQSTSSYSFRRIGSRRKGKPCRSAGVGLVCK